MTGCLAGCDHDRAHGLCAAHGEPRPRACGCPPRVPLDPKVFGTVFGRRVLADVHHERLVQDGQWGEQNHPDGTSSLLAPEAARVRRATQAAAARGRVTWMDILVEEVAEALAEEDPARLRAELVQVAAVAVAWAEAIDRRAARRDERG